MEHITNSRYNWPVFPLQRRNHSSQDARPGQFGSRDLGNFENFQSSSYSAAHLMAAHQSNYNMRAGYTACGYSTVVPATSFPFISTESNLSFPPSTLNCATSTAPNTSDFSNETGGKTGGWLHCL